MINAVAENLPVSDLDDEVEPNAQVARHTTAELRALLAEHQDRYQPILTVFRDQPWRELLTARELIDALSAQGLVPSERTLRLHCAELCELGFLHRDGRRGYRLTNVGTEIAQELTVHRRLGSILYQMEETTCQLTFDPEAGAGLVSVNAYVLPVTLLPTLAEQIDATVRAGLAVGDRVLLAAPGEDILGREVPAGHVGLGTICSLTLAAILQRRGVPSHPTFGGLLRVAGGQPAHFLEMVRYDGTSLSPNEMFIRAHLTSVGAAARGGTGAITASFRELPMSTLPALRQVDELLRERRFPGILAIGRPGQPVMNVPVHEGRVGLVLATGLNPLACLWEQAVLHAAFTGPDNSRPMVGPADYATLIPISDLRARAAALFAAAQHHS
jgi:repressor of nif and glnA expression